MPATNTTTPNETPEQRTWCPYVVHGCLKPTDTGHGNRANPDAGHVAFHFETCGTGMRGFTGKAEKCFTVPMDPGSWVVGYRGGRDRAK